MAVFVRILSYSSSLLQTNDLELREKIFWNNATGKTIFLIASKSLILSVNWSGSSVVIFVFIFIFYFLLNLLQTILNGNNFLKHSFTFILSVSTLSFLVVFFEVRRECSSPKLVTVSWYSLILFCIFVRLSNVESWTVFLLVTCIITLGDNIFQIIIVIGNHVALEVGLGSVLLRFPYTHLHFISK